MRSVRSFAVRATVLLTTVALVCSTANAVLTTYSDRSLFLAALPGAAEFESFEDEALDLDVGSRTISTSTSSIEFLGDSGATFGVSNIVAGGRGPTHGVQYLQAGFIGTSRVLFEFPSPVLAFGIDVVDKNVNDLDGLIGDLLSTARRPRPRSERSVLGSHCDSRSGLHQGGFCGTRA